MRRVVVVALLAVLIVVFNLLSDILATWLNPRLRHQFRK